MKTIDSHVHMAPKLIKKDILKDLSQRDIMVCSMENEIDSFIEQMSKSEIEKAIVFGVPHKNIAASDSNLYIYEAYLKHQDLFIPFCRLDDNLEENLNKGFKGAKLHLVYEDLTIDEAGEKGYFNVLEKYDCPIIVHAEYEDKPTQIKKILGYAPKLKIILAHMGRYQLYTMEGVLDILEELKDYPNVYFGTSTVGFMEAIEEGVKIVGEDRIVFGSDYPFSKMWKESHNEDYSYKNEKYLIINSSLSDSTKEKILYENINNILKL